MNSKIYYRDIYRKANYYKDIVLRIIDEIDSKCEQAAMSHFNGIDARISCNELYISDGFKRNITRIIAEKDLSVNRINDMIIDSLKSNNFDDKDIEVSYDIDRSIDDEDDIKNIIYNIKVLFFTKEEIDNMW